MTSGRLVLIFLGFILIIIIALTSSRISGFIRERFGAIIPVPSLTNDKTTPTPTFITSTPKPSTTATPTIITRNGSSTPSGQTPATGPEDLAWIIIGGSLILGISLKKFTFTSG